mmetsp:Transcript_6474/g.11320  ORF Transcript_6474/g.11320 Transcript_6474/m.11320 type:complete len:163 (+) Transcript_6474:2458-2946(+)
MRPQSSLNLREGPALSARAVREAKGQPKCRPYVKRKAAGIEGIDTRCNDSPLKMKLNKKAQSLVTQSCTGLKRLIKTDENTSSHSRLKAPEVRLSTSRLPFKPTSFHVTGFELQADYSTLTSPTHLQLADSNLSFSCYNTEVLNYRLFKAPPASVYKTQTFK